MTPLPPYHHFRLRWWIDYSSRCMFFPPISATHHPHYIDKCLHWQPLYTAMQTPFQIRCHSYRSVGCSPIPSARKLPRITFSRTSKLHWNKVAFFYSFSSHCIKYFAFSLTWCELYLIFGNKLDMTIHNTTYVHFELLQRYSISFDQSD